MGHGGRPTHKNDLNHEKFVRLWQAADSLEDFCAVANMDSVRAQNLAGYLRKNKVNLKHFRGRFRDRYNAKIEGYEKFIETWNDSACTEEIALRLKISVPAVRTLAVGARKKHGARVLKALGRSSAKMRTDYTPDWIESLDKLKAEGSLTVFDTIVLAYLLKVSRQRAHQIILSALTRGYMRKLPSNTGKVYKYTGGEDEVVS